MDELINNHIELRLLSLSLEDALYHAANSADLTNTDIMERLKAIAREVSAKEAEAYKAATAQYLAG